MRDENALKNEFNNDDLALVEMAMLALGVVWGMSLSTQRYRYLKTLAAMMTYLGCTAVVGRRNSKRKRGKL